MQINISTRHGHLSPDTQEKIVAKLQRLARFNERLTAVNATVDLEHAEAPHVELRVSVERAADFVATDSSGSLLGSLDSAIHKLEQQLRRHKERTTDRRTSGRRGQVVSDDQQPGDESEGD